MGAYLIDHPPARDQFRSRSRKPTGLTVVHTAESVMDSVGPDTGAESVADFIRRRDTPGSYHDLVDSDTGLTLVPYELAAYQDGTGSNSYALSISFACRTSDWRAMSADRCDAFLRQGAATFRRQQAWLRAKGYPTTPLRRITKAQSDAGVAGFIAHGDRDPGRRSDPGVISPNLFPWDRFFQLCADDTTQEEDDMTPEDRAILRQLAARAGHIEQMAGAIAGRQLTQIQTDGALAGQVAGLAVAVAQLGGGGGVDMAAIKAAAEEAAERTVAELGEKLARPNDPA